MTVPPASRASTGRAPSSVVTVKWPPSDCVTVTRVPGSVTVDPLGIRVASQSRARAMDPLFSSGRLDDLYYRPSDSVVRSRGGGTTSACPAGLRPGRAAVKIRGNAYRGSREGVAHAQEQ